MIDEKRHFEKPIELSPLVAIDRERCILCYRCVRFSQEVSEDAQLQLLERGDRTFVGTFDDRPYVAPFHGNITDLCPVGALTSYTYRFRARPWDIEQAGSVCTLCPSQCNVSFTVRDEKVKRVIARDNAEVDDGWLCDRGRYGFEMFDAPERVDGPRLKGGAEASWDEAIAKAAADGRCSAGRRQGRGDRRRRLQRGGLPGPAASCARRSARRTSTRAPRAGRGREALRAARPARASRPRSATSTRPTRSSSSAPTRCTARRSSTCASARRSAATAPSWSSRPSARPRSTAAPRRSPATPPASATALPRRAGRAPCATATTNVADAGSPTILRDAGEVVVIWGERIGREDERRRRPCSTSPPPSTSPARTAPACSKSPTPPTPAACARPAASPTPAPASPRPTAGKATEEIRAGPESGELNGPDPLRRRPPARLPRHPGLGRGPDRRRLRRRLLDARERDHRQGRRRLPARDPRRERRHRHPPRRPPAARPPQRLPPRRHPPQLRRPLRAVR